MKFVSWFITIPITVVIVVFALNNRDQIQISLWPLPADVSGPAFLWLYITFVLGIACGAIVASLSRVGRR